MMTTELDGEHFDMEFVDGNNSGQIDGSRPNIIECTTSIAATATSPATDVSYTQLSVSDQSKHAVEMEIQATADDAHRQQQPKCILALADRKSATEAFASPAKGIVAHRDAVSTAATRFSFVQHDGTVAHLAKPCDGRSITPLGYSKSSGISKACNNAHGHHTLTRTSRQYEERVRSKPAASNFISQTNFVPQSWASLPSAVGPSSISSLPISVTRRHSAATGATNASNLHQVPPVSSLSGADDDDDTIAAGTTTNTELYARDGLSTQSSHLIYNGNDGSNSTDQESLTDLVPSIHYDRAGSRDINIQHQPGVIQIAGTNSLVLRATESLLGDHDDDFPDAVDGVPSVLSNNQNNDPNDISVNLSVAHAVSADDFEAQIRKAIIAEAVQATSIATVPDPNPVDSGHDDTSRRDGNGDDPSSKQRRLMSILLCGVIGCAIIGLVTVALLNRQFK